MIIAGEPFLVGKLKCVPEVTCLVAAEEARSHGILNFRIKSRLLLAATLIPTALLLFFLRDVNAVPNLILQSGILIDSTILILGIVLVDWAAKRKYPPHLP